MNLEWMIEKLVEQVEFTYSRLLVGGASESVHRSVSAMRRKPKIGDLVVVQSVPRNTLPGERIGWLAGIEDIPIGEVQSDPDQLRFSRVFVIDRLDGSGEFRWTNVSLLRVIRESRMDQLEPIVRGY